MKERHLLVFGAILQVSHILMWNATLKLNLYGVLCTVFRRGYKLSYFYKLLFLCEKMGKTVLVESKAICSLRLNIDI